MADLDAVDMDRIQKTVKQLSSWKSCPLYAHWPKIPTASTGEPKNNRYLKMSCQFYSLFRWYAEAREEYGEADQFKLPLEELYQQIKQI